MTLLEIVNQLTNAGNEVKFRVRSDGGILITEINGTRYTGASGNTIARTMVGAELSKPREVQLKRINKFKTKKRADIDSELEQKLKAVQAKIRRRRKKTGVFIGTVSKKNIKWTLEHEGKGAALERIRQANRYASGLAYDKNIDALIGYISQLSIRITNEEDKQALQDLIDNINENRAIIKEEDILPAYQILYQVNSNPNIPIKDIIKDVKQQLGLQ